MFPVTNLIVRRLSKLQGNVPQNRLPVPTHLRLTPSSLSGQTLSLDQDQEPVQ